MVRGDHIDRRTLLALCSGVASAGLAGYVGQASATNDASTVSDASTATEDSIANDVGRDRPATAERNAQMQRAPFSGVRHKPTGGAELRQTDDGLRVALPEGDRGGIRMLLGDVEGFESRWEPLDPRETPEGAIVQASGNGVVSREGEEASDRKWLGSTTAVSDGQQVRIVTDYSPLESEAQLLVVLREGERVGTVEQYDGRVKAIVPRIPDGCGKFPPDFPRPWPVCYIWRWRTPVPIEIPDVGRAEADEFRILAADSPFGLQSLNQFDVRIGGLSELTIQSESIRYGPA